MVKVKKTLLTAISVAMLSSIVVACTTDNGASETSNAKDGQKAGKTSLRFAWWGSEERHNATLEAIKLYEERHPEIDIVPEYGGWEGFTDKLKTQLIAGEGPDVIFAELAWGIDTNYYLSVDKFPSIHLDKINKALLDQAKVNGEVKGVPVYQAVNAIVYNKTLFQELGVAEPKQGWTWADYAAKAKEITEKSKGKVYGAVDDMAGNASADVFYAQMKALTGKPVYSADGIVYSDQDALKVVQYWEELRAAGAVTTPDISAADDSNQNSPLVKRQAAMQFRGASIFGRLQSNTKDELAMVPVPRGDFSPDAAITEVIMTINKHSKAPEEVAKFIDFFINDLDAAKLLKNVRGVSSNSEVRDMLANSPDLLDASTRALFKINSEVYAQELAPMDPIPEKFDEFRGEKKLFDQVMQKLAFDKSTPEEAIQELREKGEAIFKK
ncbi:multiple sugar transport system substrate-binding protein [Paenibacillus sp. UNC496MF]|uniref:ABC transporter substrate-binding protein n=1 Tax=Paenibacillus sp. UNC496MF TaxID=1502753 RepID=UPI0008EE8D7F|nr:ABC transporter substrate-binding protein [Paenibacillus sp. UNC496MF]SFJ82580.1 multiple sugar transport system substrate-binding protein [Paenibacillus sp. UNC496MF]